MPDAACAFDQIRAAVRPFGIEHAGIGVDLEKIELACLVHAHVATGVAFEPERQERVPRHDDGGEDQGERDELGHR